MSAVATSRFAATFQSYARMGTQAGNRAASLGAAQKLTTFLTATGSAEDEDKAKSPFETYKDSVDLNNSLSRSVESNKDALRSQKINKAKERIERLKEMLRFATPEQAKRLLKELKQVAKEFKSASQDLKSAGQSLSGGATGAGALAGASSLTGATGSPAVTADAGALGSEALGAGGQVPVPVTDAVATASISEASVPTSAPEAGPASPSGADQAKASGQADQSQASQGQTDQRQNGEEQDRSSPEEQKSESWKEDLAAAILTYTERQQETDRAHTASRRSGLQRDKEALAKMADDIKALAAQIERLLKRDDRDSKKDLKDVREDLKDGIKALRDTEIGAEPEVPSTVAAGSTDAVSAANVTANVSVQVSDIVV